MTKEELKELRGKLELTQEEMAAKLLISTSLYGLYERGDQPISPRTNAMAEGIPKTAAP